MIKDPEATATNPRCKNDNLRRFGVRRTCVGAAIGETITISSGTSRWLGRVYVVSIKKLREPSICEGPLRWLPAWARRRVKAAHGERHLCLIVSSLLVRSLHISESPLNRLSGTIVRIEYHDTERQSGTEVRQRIATSIRPSRPERGASFADFSQISVLAFRTDW